MLEVVEVGRGNSLDEEESLSEMVPPICPLFVSSLLFTDVEEVEGLRGEVTTGKYDFGLILNVDGRLSICEALESLRESVCTTSAADLDEFNVPVLTSAAKDMFDRPACVISIRGC